jgi:TonB family protein
MQFRADCPAASESRGCVSTAIFDRYLSFCRLACLSLRRKDMNSALLYRWRGRWMCWVAFVSALAIHVGAVALAKTKSTPTGLTNFSAPGVLEFVDMVEPEPALEASTRPPPLEQIYPDQDVSPEEDHKPSPLPPYRKARPTSLVRGTTATASLRSLKTMVLYAPCPVYPYEARRQRVTGSGVALLNVDLSSGIVTDVIITESCGNSILDNSTRDAFRRWRFKPGTVTRVQVPITYALTGVSY